MAGLDLSVTRKSLFRALIDSAGRFGRDRAAVEDPERSPLSYGRLILGSFVLGGKLIAGTKPGDAVGLMLPNVRHVAVAVFGLAAHGRVAAMLNFTAGLANLSAALETAKIRRVVTSRKFIDTARLEDVVAGLSAAGAEILYLEDIGKAVTSWDKAVGVLKGFLAGAVHARHEPSPDAPAVILFTSGSEGKPKGVVLSSANLLANVAQVAERISSPPLGPHQVFFNPLPVFHSYGLTGGLVLPIVTGMKTVLYPSPLHYRQIPKIIRDVKATVLLGTDTFMQGWAKAAEKGDLDGLQIVVTGAERVRESTRALYPSAQILEGYGATECSPVIAVNTPHDNRPGTVGQVLKGMEWRLDPVEGLSEGGRLVVRGPNVMAGYMLHDRPAVLQPPADGWHDTGDIVALDADGFVTIRGRAKRFAKIGGEMVSLATIESLASGLWPGAMHVAVTLPDPRKGEQIVLVTDKPEADRSALVTHAQAQGYPELWVPRAVLVTAAVPVLGSGKVDFAATQELARSMRPML